VSGVQQGFPICDVRRVQVLDAVYDTVDKVLLLVAVFSDGLDDGINVYLDNAYSDEEWDMV